MALRFETIPATSVSNAPMHTASENVMRKYPGSYTQLRAKSSEDVGRRVCKFLRDRHPRKTADEVAAETGLAPTTISSWLDRATVPGGIAFIALIEAYGPEFLAEVMPRSLGWLSEASRQAELDRALRQRAALDARVEALRK